MSASAVQPAIASHAPEPAAPLRPPASLQPRSLTAPSKLAQRIDTSTRLVAQRERSAELIGATLQPKLAVSIDGSPRLAAQAQCKAALFAAPVQKKAPPHHLPHVPEEDETHQLKATPNRTGLPDNLKVGVESLSGMSLDHVKVHYNSAQPARLNALAYAQGSDTHLAPGQEKHVPHEAWHIVQQAQGRVKPTIQLKGSVPVNDDAGLEREAEVMGARAAGSNLQLAAKADKKLDASLKQRGQSRRKLQPAGPVQAVPAVADSGNVPRGLDNLARASESAEHKAAPAVAVSIKSAATINQHFMSVASIPTQESMASTSVVKKKPSSSPPSPSLPPKPTVKVSSRRLY